MRWLWRTVAIALLAFLGFVAGGLVGAQLVADRNGFEGGATVALWGMGGMVIAVAGGAMVLARLSTRRRHGG